MSREEAVDICGKNVVDIAERICREQCGANLWDLPETSSKNEVNQQFFLRKAIDIRYAELKGNS